MSLDKQQATIEIQEILNNEDLTPTQFLASKKNKKLVEVATDSSLKDKHIRFLQNQKYYLKQKISPRDKIKAQLASKKTRSIIKSKDKIITAIDVLKEEVKNDHSSINQYIIKTVESPVDARNNEFYDIMEEAQKQVKNCLKHSSLYHSCDIKHFELKDKEGNIQRDRSGTVKTIAYFVDKETQEIVAPFTHADTIGHDIHSLATEIHNLFVKTQKEKTDLELNKVKELNKQIEEFVKTYKTLKSIENDYLYKTKNRQAMIVDNQKALFISAQNDRLQKEIKQIEENQKKEIREVEEDLDIEELEKTLMDNVKNSLD